ncbi:MAG: TolC family protein [Acidobacteria bacterium]|nr:TolC family protein [Acidobacteriota bacterium]
MLRLVVAVVTGVLLTPAALPADQTGSVRVQAPMTVRAAIAEALARSPHLQPQRDAADLAEIQQELASSRFGLKIAPTFAGGTDPGGFGRQQFGVNVSKRISTGARLLVEASSLWSNVGATEFRDAGYSVGISQPLLRGFGPAATADLKSARRAVESADRSFAEARQQLVVRVAQAYFAIVREQRLVDAGERALERATKLRAASEARAKVGLATQLDVLRADLLASQAQATLALQREALASAADQLKTLLGRPLEAPLQIAADDPLEFEHAISDVRLAPVAPTEVELWVDAASGAATVVASRLSRTSESVDTLVAAALHARFEVREARERIADARRAMTVARWNLLPDVTLNVGYSRRGLGFAEGDPFARLFNGWRFWVGSSYAVDRATEGAAVASAAISVRGAEQAADDVERRIAAEVRQVQRGWQRAAETIAIQEKALELAERQLLFAQLRYERGLAGNFDVIDAENNAFQARAALIAAQVDRAMAALALRRVTGTLDPNEFLR